MSTVGGDNVQNIDATLTTAISTDLALINTLQGLISSANANPQPNYTLSGPMGSQTVDWHGYIMGLSTQLDEVSKRLERWFKLKTINMPYFRVRKGW
jgi:hypothetical protein